VVGHLILSRAILSECIYIIASFSRRPWQFICFWSTPRGLRDRE